LVTPERDEFKIEQLLAVSLVVIFQPDPLRKESRRYQSVVRGWRRGEYIMLDRPRVDGRSFLMLRESQDCQIRYMFEGKACGFDSRVIDFDTRRHNPYMRVRWPEQLEYTYFRRGERIKVNFPCAVEADGRTHASAVLKELSQGGCGFELSQPLEKGQTVELSCELPNGVIIQALPLMVCGVREQGRSHFHGCAFTDDPHPGKDDIGFFVVSRLAAEHGAPSAAQAKRVLVLDAVNARASIIARQLNRKGHDTSQASSIVDACYRLKTLPHSAVAIASELPGLSGAALLGLLRATPEFERLPVVLYGTDESTAGSSAAHTVYVPASPSIGPDTASALIKLIA
jgi:CheY-like chemotaxis protein